MPSADSRQAPPDHPSEPGEATDPATVSAIFRPIHYLGSKLRLAPAIADALDDADPERGTVLDLFAGSGTTALAMAAHRRVIASDIQEYSRVVCGALLGQRPHTAELVSDFQLALQEGSPSVAKLKHAVAPLVEFEKMALEAAGDGNAEPICLVLEHGSILAAERGIATGSNAELQRRLKEVAVRLNSAGLGGSADALTTRYFGGSYFSYEQAFKLDALALISKEKFSKDVSDLLGAALLSTASDVVNTVGKQFAQPIRPRDKTGQVKRHLISKIVRDRQFGVDSAYLNWLTRYVAFKTPGTGHVAVRSDFRDALKKFAGKYSVVYADPPYTRDHYSRFYHVLETISRRDNPEIAKNPGSSQNELSRGLYRSDRHQSPFCIKSQAADAFVNLFQLASSNGANLVLSYSPFESGAHPRLMHIDALISTAEKFYSNVELETVDGVSHSKLNHSSLNFEVPPEAEVLLVCRLKS